MPRNLNQRGFLPVPIIIIIAALLLGGVAVSTGIVKVGPNKPKTPTPSPSSQTDSKNSKETKTSWQEFKNDQYGYSLKYPPGWIVKDNSGSDHREVLVVQPQNLANVLIAARKDDSLKDKAGLEKAIAARKEFLQSEQGLKIANFKSQVEDKKGGWMMVGEKTNDGKQWAVMERGLLDIYGKVLLEQAGYSQDGKDYKDVVIQILDSFKVE